LYISRKTASVHVGNILRRLGVSTRVQAAALAERAGLVESRRTGPNAPADASHPITPAPKKSPAARTSRAGTPKAPPRPE
jgi:hypothetical protein